jgi:hypothetical protein
LVAATHVAALLRHRRGNPGTFRRRDILLISPRLVGGIVTQSVNRRLAGFAAQLFIANIDVAIAHDCHPLLEVRRNSTHDCMERLQSGWCESDVPVLRFTVVAPQTEAFHQRKVDKASMDV